MATRVRPGWTQLGIDKLASSNIPLEQAERMGMREVPSAATLDPSFEALPALVLPYYNEKGEPLSWGPKQPDFYRVRYLKDPLDFAKAAGKKPQRYAQAGGTGVCAYMPKIIDWAALAADPNKQIMITEGELKAACACWMSYPTIGLGGVWSFRAAQRGNLFLPELEKFNWRRRTATICYDSDAHTNPNVAQAINALAEELQERGAEVYTLILPQIGDKKTGLDDYFTDHDGEDFDRLLAEHTEYLGMSKTLWRMNNEVLYVRDPGIVIVKDSGQKMTPGAFKEHSDWSTANTAERVVSKDGVVITRKVPAAPVWMGWPLRRTVERVTYAPGEPKITDENEFNQWPGWGVEPLDGTVRPWLNLTEYLWEEATKAELIWFYDWCSYPIQNPGIKMFTDVLIHGVAEGTGKSLVGYTLGKIYGKNFKEIKNEDLDGGYTAWAENKQFILGDEITGSDKRERAETLKRLITQRSITVNIKFLPQYDVPDCINYLWTSNHADAFFLSDNDRRHYVVETPDKPLSLEFYKNYDEQLWRGPLAQNLFHWLRTRKISKGFSPTAPAPRSDAKTRMIMASKGDVGAWVEELKHFPSQVLRTGQLVHVKDVFSAEEILQLYKNDHPDTKITRIGMGKALAAAGLPQPMGGQPLKLADGRMQRCYIVRNVVEWRKASRRDLERNMALPPVRGKK